MTLLLTTVLPTAASGRSRTMGEQIEDRRCQVVVGIHQARAARDDAMPVEVGIVAEGDVEAVFSPISRAMA